MDVISCRSLRGNVDRNNQNSANKQMQFQVVPYVGTWIEIPSLSRHGLRHMRRSLRGNVDRNTKLFGKDFRLDCRSLRGNVDRNPEELYQFRNSERRSLRGNVDRNSQILENNQF